MTEPIKKEVGWVLTHPLLSEPFPILKTYSGFWKEPSALNKLVGLVASGQLVQNVLSLCGISKRQWGYFNNAHPDFCHVLEEIQKSVVIKASRNLNSMLDARKKYIAGYKTVKYPDGLTTKTPVFEDAPDHIARWHATKFILEHMDPRFSKKNESFQPEPVPARVIGKPIIDEAILNKETEMILRRRIAEMEKHGESK